MVKFNVIRLKKCGVSTKIRLASSVLIIPINNLVISSQKEFVVF